MEMLSQDSLNNGTWIEDPARDLVPAFLLGRIVDGPDQVHRQPV